jgi:hypothetical protein
MDPFAMNAISKTVTVVVPIISVKIAILAILSLQTAKLASFAG